jgi:exopolysaccharide biosynthesis polyprenyl glycosylphosphotransferase
LSNAAQNIGSHSTRTVSDRTVNTPGGGVSKLLHPIVMQVISDALMCSLGLLFFLYLREQFNPNFRVFSWSQKLLAAMVSSIYWYVFFWCGGLYRDYYVRSPFAEFFSIARQTFLGILVIFTLIYLDSNEQFQSNPRFSIILYWMFLCVVVMTGRTIVRGIQRYLRVRQIITIPSLIIGSPARRQQLHSELDMEPSNGYVIVSEIDTSEATAATLQGIIRSRKVKEVLLAVDHTNHDELLNITSIAADEGCLVKIVPDLYEIVSGQARTHQTYGSPLIDVSPELMKPWEWFAKRLLDIVVSFLVLVLGLPIWLLVAVGVKVSSPGPVLYKQLRAGKGGVNFTMYKFRSMKQDDGREPTWTTTNDPRVTAFGRFIRKTHIDEIPQAWNVLLGEMSIVGPRPEVKHFVEKWSEILPYYRRRLKVRPGITGWWQVKTHSNDESVEEIENRLRYDFFYIENMSFALDIEIMARTIVVMLRGHGRA